MNRKTWLMVDALVIITMVVWLIKEVKRNHHVVEPPMISHQEMVQLFDEVKVNWKEVSHQEIFIEKENDGVADADTVNPHLPEQTSFALEMEAANARALRAGGR